MDVLRMLRDFGARWSPFRVDPLPVDSEVEFLDTVWQAVESDEPLLRLAMPIARFLVSCRGWSEQPDLTAKALVAYCRPHLATFSSLDEDAQSVYASGLAVTAYERLWGDQTKTPWDLR